MESKSFFWWLIYTLNLYETLWNIIHFLHLFDLSEFKNQYEFSMNLFFLVRWLGFGTNTLDMDDFQPFQFRPPSSERPLPAHLMQLCSAVGDSQLFFLQICLGKISNWFWDDFLDDFVVVPFNWPHFGDILYVSKPLSFTLQVKLLVRCWLVLWALSLMPMKDANLAMEFFVPSFSGLDSDS